MSITPRTMSGMTLEHLLASVEPSTDLEHELYARLSEIDTGFEYVALREGFDTPESLGVHLDLPECPRKEWLDEVLDDTLALEDEPSQWRARGLYDKLKELQNELPG